MNHFQTRSKLNFRLRQKLKTLLKFLVITESNSENTLIQQKLSCSEQYTINFTFKDILFEASLLSVSISCVWNISLCMYLLRIWDRQLLPKMGNFAVETENSICLHLPQTILLILCKHCTSYDHSLPNEALHSASLGKIQFLLQAVQWTTSFVARLLHL